MKVGIIGGGIVGAAIAYRLSKVPGLVVQVFDQRPPETLASTGAALGVLMAAISSKLKGRHLSLRLDSLQLYETLIPELCQQTGLRIPYNRNGIVQLCFEASELERWQTVQSVRQQQGFALEIWSQAQFAERLPDFGCAYALEDHRAAVGAIYSPQDRQVNPTLLTQALLQGAILNGAEIHFEAPVIDFLTAAQGTQSTVTYCCTPTDQVALDWVIVSAGLGSMLLTQMLKQTLPIQPVLGQALHLQCSIPSPLWETTPVLTGKDVHLVPISPTELWIGATVEFLESKTSMGAPNAAFSTPDPQRLTPILQQAVAFCPRLRDAQVLRTWSGLRPRPSERAAPVIEYLPGYDNVLIASGHYRNGVLLAPITAEKVWDMLQSV